MSSADTSADQALGPSLDVCEQDEPTDATGIQVRRSLSFSRLPLSAAASLDLPALPDYSVAKASFCIDPKEQAGANNFQRFASLRVQSSPCSQLLASRPISFGTSSMPASNQPQHDVSLHNSAFAPIHRATHPVTSQQSQAAAACSSNASVVSGPVCAQPNTTNTANTKMHLSKINGPGNQYVKLNVGGSLHYTTIATLTRYDSMLRAMFSGRMDVLTDDDGWVLVDRSGKHFGSILNVLRDGENVLPSCRRDMLEILAEAKYYCIQELIEQCQDALCRHDEQDSTVCRVPIIQTAKQLATILRTSRKPVVKVLLNRNNNKYSYTSQSDDNLLKNLELFDKLVVRFNERILFVKDVGAANEVCSWTFYGLHKKVAEVCCTSIVYATDKKHTKVEFPEARIYEEAMNILLYESSGGSGSHSNTRGMSRCNHCAAEQSPSGAAACESATSSALSSPTFEQEYRAYSDKVDKARRDLRQN